jgi:hypothetical protein
VAQQRVHRVVRHGQPAAGQRILVLDRGPGVLGELAGEQTHPGQHRTHLSRDHRVRMLKPSNDGDMPGEAAHPPQVTHRVQNRDHHPQISRDRRLQREQGDAAPVHIVEHPVHLVTISDDHSSEGEISLVQRDRRVGHHLTGQPGHPRELGHQLIQLGVERCPHHPHLLRPIGTPTGIFFVLHGQMWTFAAKNPAPENVISGPGNHTGSGVRRRVDGAGTLPLAARHLHRRRR